MLLFNYDNESEGLKSPQAPHNKEAPNFLFLTANIPLKKHSDLKSGY